MLANCSRFDDVLRATARKTFTFRYLFCDDASKSLVYFKRSRTASKDSASNVCREWLSYYSIANSLNDLAGLLIACFYLGVYLGFYRYAFTLILRSYLDSLSFFLFFYMEEGPQFSIYRLLSLISTIFVILTTDRLTNENINPLRAGFSRHGGT